VALYQLSDKNGFATFTRVTVNQDSLASEDAFLLDDSIDALHPAIYVWLGRNASLCERRLSIQYAQNFLHNKRQEMGKGRVTIPIIKQEEGFEEEDFMHKLKGQV
jgi:gelsolin